MAECTQSAQFASTLQVALQPMQQSLQAYSSLFKMQLASSCASSCWALEAGSTHAIKTNNWLVQTSNKFQASSDDLTGSNQDCNSALQSATAIGFQALWGGITFCVDAMQLV